MYIQHFSKCYMNVFQIQHRQLYSKCLSITCKMFSSSAAIFSHKTCFIGIRLRVNMTIYSPAPPMEQSQLLTNTLSSTYVSLQLHCSLLCQRSLRKFVQGIFGYTQMEDVNKKEFNQKRGSTVKRWAAYLQFVDKCVKKK